MGAGGLTREILVIRGSWSKRSKALNEMYVGIALKLLPCFA